MATSNIAPSCSVPVLPAQYRKKPTWRKRNLPSCFLRVFEGKFDPTSACVSVDEWGAARELRQHGFGNCRTSAAVSSQEESSSCKDDGASDVTERRRSPAPEDEFQEDHSSEDDHLPEAKRLKYSHEYATARCPDQHTYCLLLVEAFYLAHAMNTLTVYSPSGDAMDHLELWRAFLTADSGHPVQYAAYHHLRIHGWVPRCGLKFGVEYLAYREGVGQYHSSYCVKVRDVSEACVRGTGPGWLEVTALQRVAEGAGKNLLVVDVAVPSSTSVDHPRCVQQFAIEQTLVKRWHYTRDRTSAGSDVD